MILKIINILKLPITPANKLHYSKMFDEYKFVSSENTAKKQQEETVLSFNDYIDKVKETFGVNSKMFLLANLLTRPLGPKFPASPFWLARSNCEECYSLISYVNT